MISHANPTTPEPRLEDEYFVNQQIRFDPLDWEDDGYESRAAAAQALARRNLWMRALAKRGIHTKAWTLTDQLRDYKSWGVPDGRVRNVYYLTIKRIENPNARPEGTMNKRIDKV